MENPSPELFNHLLRLYLDLSERYKYVSNKLRLLEEIKAVKEEMVKENKKSAPPVPKNEVVPATPKKRGRPPKKPAAEVRQEFDSSATPSAS